MKKTGLILFLLMLLFVHGMAENNDTKSMTSYSGFVNVDLNESYSHEQNTTKNYTIMKKSVNPPRKTLLEVEAEARAIIAEEVAKVEIVKANALAVIARAVASVEIAKIREEQEKESSSDLF